MADAPAAPKTLEEAIAAIGDLQKQNQQISAELKETVKESMGRKEKLREYEKEKESAESKRLTEEGKYKELVDSYKPKAERMDAVDAVLKEILGLEIEDIPEDKRDLVPAGTPESQLKWVKQAKAKGLFGAPESEPKGKGKDGRNNPPPPSNNGKPPANGGTPEWMGWKQDDPRLTTLSLDQYQEWKKANNRPSASGTQQSKTAMAW